MRYFLLISLFLFISINIKSAETDVKVRNEKAKINLAGTLALPDKEEPLALIVLASGSGAQNRDEEVYGLKPFKVLSDNLVSNGYGVLRLDDRGFGESEGNFATAVLDDLTDDAVSAVNFVRSRFPDKKVGILGHSQGGQIAVKAAANNDADFIITLAGPAWQGDSLIMSQCRALAVATTGWWPGEALERRLLDIGMSDMPEFIAKPLLAQEIFATIGEAAKVPEIQKKVYEQVSPILTPMYRELLRYNPAEDIRNVKIPWLALNGDNDLQVLPANIQTITELNPVVITFILPGHNHLFQPSKTGLPNEYPHCGQSPSDETLKIITEQLPQLIND